MKLEINVKKLILYKYLIEKKIRINYSLFSVCFLCWICERAKIIAVKL